MNTEIDDIIHAARIRQDFLDEIDRAGIAPSTARRRLEDTGASGDIVPERLECESRERRVSLPAGKRVSLGYWSDGAGDNCWSVQSMRVCSSAERIRLFAGGQEILRLDSVGLEMFADETGSVELMQFLKHYTTLRRNELEASSVQVDAEIIIAECRAPDNTDIQFHHWRTLSVEYQSSCFNDHDHVNLSVPMLGGSLVDTMNIAFVPSNGGAWFPAQVESFTVVTKDHKFTIPAWVCERTTEHAGATYFRIPLAGKLGVIDAVDIKFAESSQAILRDVEVHVVNTSHNAMRTVIGLCGPILAFESE